LHHSASVLGNSVKGYEKDGSNVATEVSQLIAMANHTPVTTEQRAKVFSLFFF
jgi:hypothetical protein